MNKKLFSRLVQMDFPYQWAAAMAACPGSVVCRFKDAEDAVIMFAIWASTPQGVDFWSNIRDHVQRGGVEALCDIPAPDGWVYDLVLAQDGAAQDAIMLFDPATGVANPFPSHAVQWREYNGATTAWIFNPWTGKMRRAEDIGADIQGLLIWP